MSQTASAPDQAPAVESCPLPEALQHRNAIVFATQISLIYLSAPTLYVGFVQAGLCKRLHTSDTVANLPSTVFLFMIGVPILVAWLFPQARLLKRILAGAFGLSAVMGLAMAGALLVARADTLILATLVLQAGVLGACNGLINVLGWEALNRGVSPNLRGKALGLAYGWGPAFAVVGSLGAQLLLDGKLFGWAPPVAWTIAYPYNYATLFGFSALAMGLAAWSVGFFTIPLPREDVEREDFQTAIFGGFRSFVTNRVLLMVSVAYLLVYCGNLVQVNMSIFTHEAVGQMSENFAGYQLTLRFSFKILCGFVLGWLLTRTNPKVPLLVTVGLQIAGVVWILLVPGYWFLLAFGLNGAGELFGVYYMNYAVQCSAKWQVRRNIAFLTLIGAGVGVAPVIYGLISDHYGIRASFVAALAVLALTTVFVALKLPRRPQPRAEDLRDDDAAAAPSA